MTSLSFIYNVKLISIQNVVNGSYFAIYNEEIVMKLYLVVQEKEAFIILTTGAKNHQVNGRIAIAWNSKQIIYGPTYNPKTILIPQFQWGKNEKGKEKGLCIHHFTRTLSITFIYSTLSWTYREMLPWNDFYYCAHVSRCTDYKTRGSVPIKYISIILSK